METRSPRPTNRRHFAHWRKVLGLALLALACALPVPLAAQDEGEDLLGLLEDDEPTTEYAYATFKGTRVINSESVDLQPANELQFLITHRFGTLNSGFSEFWGLDQAEIRIGFEYGVNDWLALGLGRSRVEDTYDFYAKARLLRQSSGAKTMPVSAVLHTNAALRTSPFINTNYDYVFTDRLFYTTQLLVARKFNDDLSLQLMPTYMHRNLTEFSFENHDMFALGVGGRWRFTNRMAILVDYYHVFDNDLKTVFNNPLALAWEIETGGHVFTLNFGNTNGMTPKLYLTQTRGRWLDGDIHFGFNIARTFPLKRK